MSGSSSAGSALDGVRVVDLTQLFPGPLCTMMLGDMGAEIIKIEPPGSGDGTRSYPALFRMLNRNKKSVVIDLKSSEGLSVLLRLAERADVFVEGFRPGVCNNLGAGYEDIKSRNPGIIYCSITGFGQDGKHKDLPAHDINIMALSGALDLMRDDRGKPVDPGIEIADVISALTSSLAITAALRHKSVTGEGQYIDISMLDSAMSLLLMCAGSTFETGKRPDVPPTLTMPHYGVFETSDGRHISIGIVFEDLFWRSFCKSIGLERFSELTIIERIARKAELKELISEAVKKYRFADLCELLYSSDIAFAPVNRLEETLEDDHLLKRGTVDEMPDENGNMFKIIGSPLRMSLTKASYRLPPPEHGSHTREMLAEAGYSEEEILRMLNNGIIF